MTEFVIGACVGWIVSKVRLMSPEEMRYQEARGRFQRQPQMRPHSMLSMLSMLGGYGTEKRQADIRSVEE